MNIHESNFKGITLMSLVITIIVLLILAGITISFALNDSGVLKQSKLARATYENAASQEQGDLNAVQQELTNAINNSSYNDSTISDLEKRIEELENEIDDLRRQNDDLKSENDRLNDENSNLSSTQAVGNATPEQVLSGATFSTSTAIGQTGTMSNHADTTTAWSGYETISVQPHPSDNSQGLVTILNQYGALGFYNKNSRITGNIANLNAANIKAGVNVGRVDGTAGITGSFTSDGTATADNISNGKVAYVNGQRIVGNGSGESNNYNSGYSNGYSTGYSAGKSAGGIVSVSDLGGSLGTYSVTPGEVYLVCTMINNQNNAEWHNIYGGTSLSVFRSHSGAFSTSVDIIKATGTSLTVSKNGGSVAGVKVAKLNRG